MAKHLKIGATGELAVLNHLRRKGFLHLESNFLTKAGEIDIIVVLDGKVHFVEVKTVSRGKSNMETRGVSHGTSPNSSRGTHRPEDNVHRDKLRKLLNTIQIWLLMNKYEGEWQLDIAAVELDQEMRTGKVKMIENVIVE